MFFSESYFSTQLPTKSIKNKKITVTETEVQLPAKRSGADGAGRGQLTNMAD